MITINGKEYRDFKEWAEEEKKNPNSTVLIWDYQHSGKNVVLVNGKFTSLDGISHATGKCTWKGKTYEGEITYDGDDLYVGGKFVKNLINSL